MHSTRTKRAQQLLTESQWDEALTLINKQLAQNPDDQSALTIKAQAQFGLGEHKKAITSWQIISNLRKLSAQETNSLAISYRFIGKATKSIALLHALEEKSAPQFALFHNLGNAYSDTGKLDTAIDYYQKAITLKVDYIDSHINLNKLLWAKNYRTIFGQSFITALKKDPNNLPLRLAYVQLLLRTQQLELADMCLKKTPIGQQTSATYINSQAQLLSYQNKTQEAISLTESALGKAAFEKNHIIDYIEWLLKQERFGTANEYIHGMLSVHKADQHLLALQSYCVDQLFPGTPAVLNNYQELVRIYDMPDNKDQDTSIFCDALLRYLSTLHTAKHHPIDQSLRTGTQTQGELFTHDQEQIIQAQEFFSRCIIDYANAIKNVTPPYTGFTDYESHRFSGSWSVQLQNNGYHQAHMHPMGWLSSVFYVQVPEVCRNPVEKQGWLHFGQPHFASNVTSEKAKRCIAPVAGRLVLFPSYFWHGTFAFNSVQKRTTIAFDVVKNTLSKRT